MDLPVKALHPAATFPAQAQPGDVGFDLAVLEAVTLQPGERAVVPTGIAVAIPEGYAGLLLPRSGLASKRGLTLANAPGLIDSGYRGEVQVAIVNLDPSAAVEIRAGDRIAQLVIVAVPEVRASWVDELPASARGQGGFGSTGV
ncbi:MAG: dUTP diphosphatase [Actinomycetota bacterium]